MRELTKPVQQRAVDDIQSAYTAAYYLWDVTPHWRFLLRARRWREMHSYLLLLERAVRSRKGSPSPAPPG